MNRKNIILTMLACLNCVHITHAVDSGQNAPLNEFEHQLVTAWWKNPDLVQDIRRIKEFHKVKDQGKIANLPLQIVAGFVDPVLGTVSPGMLQQRLKPINFAFEKHDVRAPLADCRLPVVFMKKGDAVVAAYINDPRPTLKRGLERLQNAHVNTLIENLHNQHGTNLPILVNIPHRKVNPPSFSGVTGTLYSPAKKIYVSNSHDLTMYGGTGGTVQVSDHTGDFRTNADHVSISNAVMRGKLTCDNKKATIDTWIPGLLPKGYPDSVTGTLNDHHQRRARVWGNKCSGDRITVEMKNHSVERGSKAKAIIENAKIDSLTLYGGDVLIVNGKIGDAIIHQGCTAWLVDSTANKLKMAETTLLVDSSSDIYQINTEGDLSKAPGMLKKILKDNERSNEYKQKTMNSFNEIWNQRQMPHKHIPEEHKE